MDTLRSYSNPRPPINPDWIFVVLFSCFAGVNVTYHVTLGDFNLHILRQLMLKINNGILFKKIHRQVFLPQSAEKFAEISDHNIDPRCLSYFRVLCTLWRHCLAEGPFKNSRWPNVSFLRTKTRKKKTPECSVVHRVARFFLVQSYQNGGKVYQMTANYTNRLQIIPMTQNTPNYHKI
jgi:hypothetical protein